MNTLSLYNGVQMPLLGFGTFQLDGAACEESVLAALRCGYRMIDTAQAYGNEAAVGSALAKSGVPREEVFLVTKVNFRSYENARETVQASLEKLGTRYLDLVLLHWPFGHYYAAWAGGWSSCIRRGHSRHRCFQLRPGPPDRFDRISSGGAGRQSDRNPPALPAPRRACVAGKIPGPAHGLCPAGPGQGEGDAGPSGAGPDCPGPRQDARPGCAAVFDTARRGGHPQIQPSGAHTGECGAPLILRLSPGRWSG